MVWDFLLNNLYNRPSPDGINISPLIRWPKGLQFPSSLFTGTG